MKKSDLLTSDVVLSSKGSYGVVLRGTPKGDLIKWFKNNHDEIIHKYRSLDMINDDLTFKYDGKDNRIIKVYRVTDQHDMTTMNAIDDKYLIWEEKVNTFDKMLNACLLDESRMMYRDDFELGIKSIHKNGVQVYVWCNKETGKTIKDNNSPNGYKTVVMCSKLFGDWKIKNIGE